MDRREFLASVAATGGLVCTPLGYGAEAEPKTAAGQIPKRPLGHTGVDVTVLAIGGVAGMIPSKNCASALGVVEGTSTRFCLDTHSTVATASTANTAE